MSGERDLQKLLRSLSATLEPQIYVFVTIGEADLPDGIHARMIFHEAEGITLILLKTEADTLGLEYTFPCRMITLDVHSSLDAVGFIARISAELSRQGIGVNPVSAFFHDHLFVPVGREDEAIDILRRIAETS
jgi:uncharacterized protein